MPISGISHITFVVRNLERTAVLWRQALGAEEVYDSGARSFSQSPEKFFLVGGVWVAVMQGEPAERSYRHVAFEVQASELPDFERKLRALGAQIKPARKRVKGEGESLYFYDYDNNLIELHAGTLAERLRHYASAAVHVDVPPLANR
jgi:fosfomycin resistance protein FosX